MNKDQLPENALETTTWIKATMKVQTKRNPKYLYPLHYKTKTKKD